MGWLRESMAQSGLRSFGELARKALAHPDWPEDSRAQPRSLEAIFGRLDKREDLDWLADRPGIQQILGELLRVSVAEIRTILVEVQGVRPTVTRLRFDDLRVARAFDFAQEPLPPTIPERICLPATWTRCCWLADAGAGFTLAGQWLSVRGLAQCVSVENLGELTQLRQSGPPLYLELGVELLNEFTRLWHGTRPLCVAVASHSDPRLIVQHLPQDFETLLSAPVADCLEQIVDWVLYRLAGRPQSQRQHLLTWLTSGPTEWRLLRTLGDALGLIGAFVEGSIEPSRAATKEALLRQWMAHRTSELARERHRDLSALQQTLPEALVDIAQAVLIDDSRSLSAARSVDEWLSLVPENHRRGPDIDWLTTRLVSDNLPMRKPDLERAAQRLPPGAHKLVVAFRELSLLSPASATGFAVRPHFVGRLADSIARDRIVAAAPLIWGEALLRPSARVSLLPTLQTRATHQPEALAEEVLEHVDLESPALVCAFETSFVLLGLAALGTTGLGPAELSDQTAASLLEEQAALLLTDVGPIPTTRMIPFAPASVCDLPGTFFLAAWALSEHSPIRGASLPPAMDPWHAPEPPTAWPALLNCVTLAIRSALTDEPPWVAGAIRLLDRIRQSLGTAVGPDQRQHELFLVGTVLDAIELGVLEWPEFEAVFLEPWQWDFFVVSVRVRGTAAASLTQAVLSAWLDAGSPQTGYQVFERWPKATLYSAPAQVLAQLLLSRDHEHLVLSDGAELPAAVWQAWLDARGNINLALEPARPWEVAPATVVGEAFMTRPPETAAIRRVVWARHEALAIQEVERHRTLRPQAAADWLRLAPIERGPAIAEHGLRSGWLRAAGSVTQALQQLLHGAVAGRVDRWQAAYDCLNRLEAERRRFHPPR